MTTKWSHLPNAKHIDRILVSLEANPKEWAKSWNGAWAVTCHAGHKLAFNTTFCDTYGATRSEERHAAFTAAYYTKYRAAYGAARDAILALITYEDSAHLLVSSPEEIQLLIALGHPYAVLFLPAVVAFSQINELIV